MRLRRRIHAFTFFFFTSCTLCFVPPLVTAAEAERQIESLVFTCYTCHGPEGQSPGDIPTLDTLSADEIRNKLLDYRQDAEPATIMNRIAKGYSDQEISRIAEYLAEQS